MSTSSLPWFPPASDVLRAIPGGALAPLVSADKWHRIAGMLSAFPVEAQTVCCECRLSESDDRVDLALCLVPSLGTNGGGFAAGLRPLHGSLADWQRCLSFLDDWTSPGSSYLAQIPLLWVAFDLDRELPALPVPCLGMCVAPDFFTRRLGLPTAELVTIRELVALADDGFRRFFGQTIPPSVSSSIERCLSMETVTARHFSFMLGRAPATFKLDVQLPVARVGALLERIGWPGPTESLQAALRSFMPWEAQVQLNLVLHPRLAQPLEVEFLTDPSEASPDRRNLLVDALVGARLCSSAKGAVLRNMIGAAAFRLPSTMPVGAGWYVKVRFQGDQPVEAKAYFGLLPQLWPRTRGREGHEGAPGR